MSCTRARARTCRDYHYTGGATITNISDYIISIDLQIEQAGIIGWVQFFNHCDGPTKGHRNTRYCEWCTVALRSGACLLKAVAEAFCLLLPYSTGLYHQIIVCIRNAINCCPHCPLDGGILSQIAANITWCYNRIEIQEIIRTIATANYSCTTNTFSKWIQWIVNR